MTNKELVYTAFTELFIKGDVTALDRYWSADYIQRNSPTGKGGESAKQLFGSMPPGFKCEIGLILADGDYVMVHSRYTGVAPKPLIAVDIFFVRDGKLAEHWDVMQEEVSMG